MKLSKIAVAAVLVASSSAALADGWSWSDVSINYLNWTKRSEKMSNKPNAVFGAKKDFVYLELEGGMGGAWGDLYGFFDVENPINKVDNTDDPRADRRTALKIVGRYNLTKVGDYPLMAYAHVYDFVDNGFNDQNRVLGFSTDIKIGKLTVQPWIGVHQESKTGVGTKNNGGMAGYLLLYPFDVSGYNFMLSQWHETEFARKNDFLAFGNALGEKDYSVNKTGQNGAITLTWNVNKQFGTALTYRYARNKLGIAGLEDAWIFSGKYNF